MDTIWLVSWYSHLFSSSLNYCLFGDVFSGQTLESCIASPCVYRHGSYCHGNYGLLLKLHNHLQSQITKFYITDYHACEGLHKCDIILYGVHIEYWLQVSLTCCLQNFVDSIPLLEPSRIDYSKVVPKWIHWVIRHGLFLAKSKELHT